MDARQSSRGKRISQQQEKRAAADLGGRTQAASGGTRMGGGGDVRVMGDVKVECKVTEASVFVIKKSELDKIRLEAAKTLEEPIMQFAFRDKTGRLDRYAVVLGFLDKGPGIYELDTRHNSMRLDRWYLQTSLIGREKGRLCLTFRDNAIVRHWEIMTWDTFLLKRKRSED